MHCIYCGHKNPARAKFCPSCGKSIISPHSDPEPDAIQAREEAPREKKSKSPVARFISLFVLSFIFLGFWGYMSDFMSKQIGFPIDIKNFINVLLGGTVLIMGILMFTIIMKPFFGVFKKLFWYLFKYPKQAVVAVLAIIVLAFVVKNQINEYLVSNAIAALDNVQEDLTPIFLARIVGSDIENKRPYPSGWSKKRISEELYRSGYATSSHGIPSPLVGYVSAVNTWGIDILAAAEGDKQWSDVAAQPPSFTLVLSDSQIAAFFAKSIEHVANLKQFGDSAIKRQDRQSMRVIAAKLLIQVHFLDNLSLAATPSLVYAPTVYGAPIMRNPCVKGTCLADMRNITSGVYRSALSYTVGEAKAQTQWQDNWQQASASFEQAGYPIGGAGITIGGSDEPKNPPLVQAFFDSCTAGGGKIGDTGGVKTRLPTTESGYTCWEPKPNGKCWKLLTYSGGTYAGGDAGVQCPEENLLPPVADVPKAPKSNGNGDNRGGSQPRSASWDGNYSTRGSGNCAGFSSGIVPDTFSVRANTVYVSGGYTAPINSSGRAQINANISESGVGITFVQSYQFTNPQSPTVNGNFSARVSGEGIGMNCSGSFSGARQ